MSATGSIRRAARLYKGFRERAPKRARSIKVKLPRAVIVMGHLEAVIYRSTFNGKAARLKHTFAPGSRPLLCAGTGKNQLYIFEGRYRVTDRGIVDLTARGREIED